MSYFVFVISEFVCIGKFGGFLGRFFDSFWLGFVFFFVIFGMSVMERRRIFVIVKLVVLWGGWFFVWVNLRYMFGNKVILVLFCGFWRLYLWWCYDEYGGVYGRCIVMFLRCYERLGYWFVKFCFYMISWLEFFFSIFCFFVFFCWLVYNI